MKIHITINEELEETEIHIHAKEYNDDIEALLNKLKSTQLTMIDGYSDQEIHMIKISDIYSIYAENSKVYLQTEEQEFETKLKLYELEARLRNEFVRVSKSTLVNLNRISSLQMGPIGTTQLVLDNDVSIHVSRKYVKELKYQLGIGRSYK